MMGKGKQSEVTKRQIREFFRQEEKGLITKKVFQAFLENRRKYALKEIFNNVIKAVQNIVPSKLPKRSLSGRVNIENEKWKELNRNKKIIQIQVILCSG